MNHERASEDREDDREGHYFVGKEGEDARFDEEPVLLPSVDRVSEVRPDEDHQNADKLLPDLFEVENDSAERHIEEAPGI